MKPGNQSKIFHFLYFLCLIFFTSSVKTENIMGYSVILGGLDKITAKFTEFEIDVGKSTSFGSLKIFILKCEKRPPEEIPEDFVLMKIDDEINKNNPINVFSGWMLSSSPSLSPLEHSTYDIWVKDCKI